MYYTEKPIPESYISYEENSEESPQPLTDDSNPVESDVTAAF